MRKTLTLTVAAGLLAGGLAHACPPRISAAELFRVAHKAQMRGEGPELWREAELARRAARDYSAAPRLLAPSHESLRRLVIKLKNARLR